MQDSQIDKTRIADPGARLGPGFGWSPGTSIGPYRLIERLGRGGMGTVYKARDTRLERDLAIKVLSPALLDDPGTAERFLLEARAASALDHPNCCPVYDIGTAEDGSPYIAMAYCEGEPLDRRLKRGPLPAAQALAVARQVAAGLGAAHAKGIVHRDIKAANLILAPNGQVRILDFGIAKVLGSELTRTGMQVGTVAAMAPEQIAGGEIDARTDCWALGVLLYEMLTGHRPFGGGSETEVMHRILTQPPTPIGRWLSAPPPGFGRFFERALCRDPKGRFASMVRMDAALRDLERGLEDAPPVSRQASDAGSAMGRRAKDGDRRGARAAWTVAAVAVLGGLAVAGWLWLAPGPPGPASASPDRVGPGTEGQPGPVKEPGLSGEPNRGSDPPSASPEPAVPDTGDRDAATLPDPSASPPSGWTPLAWAAWTGDGPKLKHLLAEGADPSLGHPPPLVAATVRARPDLVRLLLASGADPNGRDRDGNPVLLLAGLSPRTVRLELARALLAMGADPQTEGLLDHAKRTGDGEMLDLLRRARQDPDFLSQARAALLAQVEREL